ncbi:MAG TPA: NAD(P)/FAD-dependent oxidoreductase [Caulobacterales bacterium]|nr:NAD(P)/FAD-dependent oxidoreductase [Caulobacterales bacterium]
MSSYDVVVVGAGFGGLYAIERLRREGLSVLALESASGVGGVWFHNRYPGARVDIESLDYCYQFSPELFREWRWSERYAAQDELLRYLNFVADRFDLRRHIQFNTTLLSAHWRSDEARYALMTDRGEALSCRFLVLATGNLSAARKPNFPGLESFEGEWVQSSHWPERDVRIDGRRVAVIGTGSSGVQAVTAIAPRAQHLAVFQRTPNFSVPAGNAPLSDDAYANALDQTDRREALLATPVGSVFGLPPPLLPYADYSEAERVARLEAQWTLGGQGMNRVFADQGVNAAVNKVVSDFVRAKIRAIVRDPKVAELLCPHDHPIGTRRLVLDTGYYDTFNRDNVTLVSIASDPIEQITPSGIQLRSGATYEADLIVFALGFHAFRGAMERIDFRNAGGATVGDAWRRGPRTMLGLMTAGFPNLFHLTGPGSPSVLANMALMNEQHVDFVAALIAHMREGGFATVDPEPAAQDAWTAEVAQAASKLLRLNVDNYMVHVNADDGSRVFMPYTGGLGRFNDVCRAIAADGFKGFTFGGTAP